MNECSAEVQTLAGLGVMFSALTLLFGVVMMSVVVGSETKRWWTKRRDRKS